MTLNELLDRSKKKKSISLYRIYTVGNIDEADIPILKTKSSGDIFAISPKAAFEAMLDQNKDIREAIIQNTIDNVTDAFANFGNMMSEIFDTPPLGQVDKANVSLNEDGEVTIMPGKSNQVYVVEFKFDSEELARLPQCYNMDGEELPARATGAGLIYLTILDREYEMNIKLYNITSIKIKSVKDKLVVDDITMELVPANMKQSKEEKTNPIED